MGDRVEGVEFSSQVNAIRGDSGLVAGNIARDNADWWERCTRKFLAKGKAYDSRPIVLAIDGVDLLFDAADPISGYLRPDAEITVREDSMRFRSRQEKVYEAQLMLDTALVVQKFFPKAPVMGYRQFPEADDEQSPEKWMEGSPLEAPMPTQGQQMAQQMLHGGMPDGGVQPLAEGSTAMAVQQTT